MFTWVSFQKASNQPDKSIGLYSVQAGLTRGRIVSDYDEQLEAISKGLDEIFQDGTAYAIVVIPKDSPQPAVKTNVNEDVRQQFLSNAAGLLNGRALDEQSKLTIKNITVGMIGGADAH